MSSGYPSRTSFFIQPLPPVPSSMRSTWTPCLLNRPASVPGAPRPQPRGTRAAVLLPGLCRPPVEDVAVARELNRSARSSMDTLSLINRQVSRPFPSASSCRAHSSSSIEGAISPPRSPARKLRQILREAAAGIVSAVLARPPTTHDPDDTLTVAAGPGQAHTATGTPASPSTRLASHPSESTPRPRKYGSICIASSVCSLAAVVAQNWVFCHLGVTGVPPRECLRRRRHAQFAC